MLAGYEKPMFEELLPFNHGALGSRIRRRFALSDFSDDELIKLLEFRLGLTKPSYRLSDGRYARAAARRLGKGRGNVGFANARAVESLVELAAERQTARVLAERRAGAQPDIFLIERADLLGAPPRLLDPETSAPLRALRQMEGLQQVKASVDSLLKLAESNAAREEMELPPLEVMAPDDH